MSSSEASRLAAECPIVSRAARLAAWVADGKAVTAKGVVRRADIPAAARAIGVEPPGHVLRAAHVKAIHHPWLVAEAAEMIAVGATQVVADREFSRDHAEVWRLGLEAVLRAESPDRSDRVGADMGPAVLELPEGRDDLPQRDGRALTVARSLVTLESS